MRIRTAVIAAFLAAALCMLAACGAGTVGGRVMLTPDMLVQRARLPYKIKWIKDLGVERLSDYWPFERAVPLVQDKAIYVGSTAEIFVAMEKRDGDLLWSFETDGPVESMAAADELKVYFGDSNGKVYAVTKDYGEPVWTYQTKGEVLSRLTVKNGAVFAATSYNRVLALDAETGELLWLADHDPADDFTMRGVSSPLVTDQAVYAGYADGTFVAINPQDGTEIWSNTLKRGQRFLDVDATPVIHSDKIYVASFDGRLYCLERDVGTVVWSFEHGGISPVAIDSGLIYFSSDDNLFYAVSAENGEIVWQFDVKADYWSESIYKSKRSRSQIPGPPVIVQDVVVFASMAGYVYALDKMTGEKRWAFLPGEGVTSAVIANKDRIYFLSNSGKLYCMRQSGPPSKY